MDTWFTRPRTASSAKVPATANRPTVRGRAAASRLPNASTSRTRVRGTANASARPRLLATPRVMSELTASVPPAPRAGGPSGVRVGRGELRHDRLGRVGLGFAVSLDVHRDQGGAAVLAAQRGRVAVPVGGHRF